MVSYRQEIVAALEGSVLGTPLEIHGQIGSTNERAKEWARSGAPHGALVVADHQTAGRGRFGRPWVAPAESAILASVIIRPRLAPPRAPLVTLAWAAAMREVFARETGADIRVKWPNDIVFEGGKISGILTESILGAGTIDAMVIGFGVNVNQEEGFPEGRVTSLALVAKHSFPRAPLLRAILDEGAEAVSLLEEDASEPLLDILRRHSSVLGRDVKVQAGAIQREGRAVDIDAEGRLVLETAEGIFRAAAGEVTLKEMGA